MTSAQDRWAHLRAALARTRAQLADRWEALAGRPLDEAAFGRLEEALIAADAGPGAAGEIVAQLRQERGVRSAEDARAALRRLIATRVGPTEALRVAPPLAAVLVVGVNGTGKTTTIGKLAWRLRQEGHTVLLAAADTFRAAAGEQLAVWAERVGAEVVRHRPGGDPGAVVFDALEAARARGADVVIIDTAGRLHTKVNLMEELRKVNRVVERAAPASVERLLVLDAPTGQNALAQARRFHEAVGVTGVVLTKLDGTAKGGVVLAIARDLRLPVKFLGTGEGLEDLASFDPEAFAEAFLPA